MFQHRRRDRFEETSNDENDRFQYSNGNRERESPFLFFCFLFFLLDFDFPFFVDFIFIWTKSSMDKFIRKSLLKRENCFERDFDCPQWITEVYPQIKSIEFDDNRIRIRRRRRRRRTNDDEDDDRYSSMVSLDDELNDDKSFDENLLDRIDLFKKRKSSEQIEENQCEYPDEQSYYSVLFDHYRQTNVCSSNKQLKDLFEQIEKYFQKHFSSVQIRLNEDNSLDSTRYQCQITNCFNLRVPLTRFCSKHFIENDQNQVLFEKCFLCQQIVVKHDDKHLFHLSCPLDCQ